MLPYKTAAVFADSVQCRARIKELRRIVGAKSKPSIPIRCNVVQHQPLPIRCLVEMPSRGNKKLQIFKCALINSNISIVTPPQRTVQKLMAPDCRMLCDGNAGLKRRYDLRQSAPDAGDVPVHHRYGCLQPQRANGSQARIGCRSVCSGHSSPCAIAIGALDGCFDIANGFGCHRKLINNAYPGL